MTRSFRNDILPLKDKLFRLALRITLNNAEAEDVVQETMIKVWKRRDSWDAIDNMEVYCMTVCRNMAIDRTRRMGSHTMTLEADMEPADDSHYANPEQQAVTQERINIVRQLINQLPEKQRSCMQLRDIEGHSYKDIASILGITEEQVKVNIFRARQTIKSKFFSLSV